MSKIGVIGLWHLGSVYSAGLSELGHDVIGFEDKPEALAKFREGKAPLFEPGLDELLKKHIKSGSLKFTDNFEELETREIIIVAFDTPVDERDRSDLTKIIETIETIAKIKQSPFTLVVSSQVPVGSCDEFYRLIKKRRPNLQFDIAYIPENLRLGDALNIFLKADRFVVGANNKDVYELIEKVLEGTKAPIVKVSLRSAEAAKHALNAFLATSVSFINELADVCELVGADVMEVSEALKSDVRIGRKAFLNAGLGFAGGTLARDLITLTDISHKAGMELPVIEGVLKTNATRPDKAVSRIVKAVGPISDDTTVTVLGLTYKPGTSTLRRSISLEIIKRLRRQGIKVKAFDPKADLSEIGKPEFEPCDSLEQAVQGSNAIIIITGWPEFKDLDYAPLLEKMSKPVILDLINFASPESRQKALKLGFRYLGTGIGEVHHETKK